MKFIFKNMFLLVTVLTLTLLLGGCGKSSNDTTTTNVTTTGTTTTSATTTTTGSGYNGPAIDLQGKTLTIMCNLLTECDPFNENYTGTFKEDAQQSVTDAESKFNVNISFVAYPTDAGWGPTRETAIINGVTAGQPLANIYQMTTDWIPNLVNGGAIIPVGQDIRDYANADYDSLHNEFGKFQGHVYSFQSGYDFNNTGGLYYNLDLLNELGLTSPAQLWNDGQWNWTNFKDYVQTAQAALNSYATPHYAIGGPEALWAQYMVGANGGYLIDPNTWQVGFTDTASLQAFSYLNTIYNMGVWEPSPVYDTGSSDWLSGNDLFSPGELWFTTSPIRWGGGAINFQLGYVPFPIADGLDISDYHTGLFGEDAWAMSAGFDDGTGISSQDAFIVWNEIQQWKSVQDAKDLFQISLEQNFDDPASVDANMSIIQNVYDEHIFGLGIGGWNTGEYYIVAAQTVMNGDANTYLTSMSPIYEAAIANLLDTSGSGNN